LGQLQELQETREQLQRLCQAIPTLPSPLETHARHIQIIRQPQTSLEFIAHRVSIISLTIENLRIRLATTKVHLTTLLALPPLLFATGANTKALRDEWMARPFSNDEKKLPLTDPDKVKIETEELMATLDSYSASLSGLCESFELEELHEDLSFHDEVRNALKKIKKIVDKLVGQSGRSASAQQRHEQDQPEELHEERMRKKNMREKNHNQRKKT
uniref:Mediator of RNA polymerase II transcription subunit 7 n=1 Tax=Haemonchus placei TaxID=6290 RepID=A0A0N4XBT2_HAEPC